MRYLAGLFLVCASLIVVTFGSGCAPEPKLDEIAPLKGRVTARQPLLTQMKAEGLCSEGSNGMLTRNPTARLSVEQRTLIEEENFDRERIFAAIAAAYSLPVEEVRSLFVRMQPTR